MQRQNGFAPSSKNLSRPQYQAIEELKANKDIVIKPADKGGAVVIVNCSNYLAEGYKQLSDEKVYKKLTESKTKEYHKLICDYLKHSCEVEREISRENYLYLTDFIPRTSRMYLLPKIHKPARPPPGRPAISANGSPTERISQFVDFFLQPFVSSTKSYIKDTNDFFAEAKLPENSILFSLNVVSLYTNIPTDMGLSYIEDFLNHHRHEDSRTCNEMLLKLLEFVLTCNDFEFNEEFFLQIFGTAIGTKMAPSYANLVVSMFEALYVYVYRHQPLCWFRFIDDVFGMWAGDISSLQAFVQYLNERVESLKFTLEYSTTNFFFFCTIS